MQKHLLYSKMAILLFMREKNERTGVSELKVCEIFSRLSMAQANVTMRPSPKSL